MTRRGFSAMAVASGRGRGAIAAARHAHAEQLDLDAAVRLQAIHQAPVAAALGPHVAAHPPGDRLGGAFSGDAVNLSGRDALQVLAHRRGASRRGSSSQAAQPSVSRTVSKTERKVRLKVASFRGCDLYREAR